MRQKVVHKIVQVYVFTGQFQNEVNSIDQLVSRVVDIYMLPV